MTPPRRAGLSRAGSPWLACLLLTGSAPAQDSATTPPELPLLGETVVTATRSPREAFDVPASTDVVSADQIREKSYRTTPQALRDIPGVMVQETSFGQGSPYIRGFTGFRNVFLIDGIRLNNSVFRDGPNQYWNTVDPLSLQRIEVVKGPSSVLYGSDAIGGTVNAITKNPTLYGPGMSFGQQLYVRGSTAAESLVGRIEHEVADGDSVGVLIGASRKSYGDLHGGDTVGEQEETGYDEFDADVKVETFLDANHRLVLAYQHVDQDDVPRTHRTVFAESWQDTTVGSDLRRDLDQKRNLAYAQLHGEDFEHFFDSYHLSVSWHEQSERRNRIRGSGARQDRGFEVDTYGAFFNLSSDTPIGRLTYGADYYHDDVDSYSSSNSIQGPVADDATYDLVGVFVQDEIDVGEDLTLTLGGRFNYAEVDANDVFDPVTTDETSIDDDWSKFVGSARLVYRLVDDHVHLFGGVSQGFRAPNLSDLTRLDSARTNEFEIPSPGLDEEEYISYEAGVKTLTETSSAQASFFYTDIDDQIVRVPTGTTTPTGEAEITKENVGDGWVWGIEFGGAWTYVPGWTVFGNATYLKGKVDTFPDSTRNKEREHIDRLMPFTTQLGLRWDSFDQDLWAEVVGVYADEADRLSTRDESDTSRIPPGGTPDYFLLSVRGGWRISENVVLDVGLENLTDEDYRVHGSGQNGPGLNLVAGLTLTL